MLCKNCNRLINNYVKTDTNLCHDKNCDFFRLLLVEYGTSKLDNRLDKDFPYFSKTNTGEYIKINIDKRIIAKFNPTPDEVIKYNKKRPFIK